LTEYLATTYRLIESVAIGAEARLQVEALQMLRKLTEELPPSPITFLQGSSGKKSLSEISTERAQRLAESDRKLAERAKKFRPRGEKGSNSNKVAD
jgi:hypothetical protein